MYMQYKNGRGVEQKKTGGNGTQEQSGGGIDELDGRSGLILVG